MTKNVYAQIEFVTLHQKKPADFAYNNGPKLTIGSVTTDIDKYGLEFGFGDPGEDPNADTFDFPEFRIASVSFTKPADYPGSFTYQTERLAGGTEAKTYYSKWRYVAVPDDFSIPPELSGSIVTPDTVIDALFTQIRDYATDRGMSNVLYYLDRVDDVLAARSLYDVLSDHLDDQFSLMNRALNGEISPQDLVSGSDALGQQLIQDLLVQAGVPSPVAEVFRTIAFSRIDPLFTTWGPDGIIDLNSETFVPESGVSSNYYRGFNSERTVFVGGAVDDHVRPSSGNDILYGGGGDDVLIAGGGTLIGGDGRDTYVTSYDFRSPDQTTILDFSPAEGDQIFVYGAYFTSGVFNNESIHSFQELMSRTSQVGANTVINFNDAGTLTLTNVSKYDLSPQNFLFGRFENSWLGVAGFGASSAAGGWSNDDTFHRTLADVNGDGRADIIGFGYSSTLVSLSNGSGGFNAPIVGVNSFGYSPAGGGWGSNNYTPRTAADVNGDGFADIIGFGYGGTYVSVAVGGGQFASPILTSGTFGSSAGAGGWSDNNLYHREVADVNGDGMADIVGFGYDGTYVALATGGGSFAAAKLASPTFGTSAAAGGWSDDNVYHRELADVNGDGMADIVGFGSDTTYVALATGGGNFAPAIPGIPGFGSSAAGGSWSSQAMYPRHLADVDRDGRADIVGFGYNGVMVATANPNGTFQAAEIDVSSFGGGSSAGGWSNNRLYPRLLGDIDGNGTADVVGFGSDGAYVSRSNLAWFG